MKYAELKAKSNRNARRVGRGISAGQGKTAGRGTKGQNARAGSTKRPGFEGGQNPLMQRLPKLKGFKSKRPIIDLISTTQLNELKVKIVDNNVLVEAKLIEHQYSRVKLVAGAELNRAVVVKLQSASKSAAGLLSASGGSFIKTGQVPRVKKKVK